MEGLSNDWRGLLQGEFKEAYFLNLMSFIMKEYAEETIYPPREEIFSALKYTSYENTKVVILGQDPYHGQGQAHGLSFSVKPDIKMPPSLKNIFKELHNDLGYEIPPQGCLIKWAQEGVLLLNTILTVREGQPNSHRRKGWERFTDKIITLLNRREKPVIFILWGNNAQEKESLITSAHHYIIKDPHPSPLSAHRGFLGSKPFSKTNDILKELGCNEIDWRIG